ncbi:hypothetical protein KEM54_001918 [Ascosphaera aggregata]|nr:hypothetical protein KEM54_001918 [Ascosphaera aggregata]
MTFFPDKPVPAVVGAPSSSQFAVTRDRIKKRGKNEYVRIRQWLIDTELEDDVSAKILEYVWHEQCYCNIYNHCNLTCSLGNCDGRYILPPQTDVPEGWPDLGNGKDGWPVVGWNEPKGEERRAKAETDKQEEEEVLKEKDEEKSVRKWKDGKNEEEEEQQDKTHYKITVEKQREWKPE